MSGGVTGLAVLSLDNMIEGIESGLEEKVEELVGLLGGFSTWPIRLI